ncbi:aquaporin Z [Nocardioides marmotae]|uniref:Aquaporin Z n=1 Tax=Nocardioides marmotae TaxID=2663857 RepID=A0A6I3JAG9_9ACTN|nr:aquaporin Z [Nocardioides marmotae]MCR6030751.1 aquaporin Z [Gordonia jinghuaiqii]MBC9733984.1 aquaporin Z [Nocardioides marmotae]MTB85087.1 aquaporin Z [Nocardioides marmotae]MTB94385.1 aquaporin Z [Nocardioides marmotae]QKE01589.1 aquaporin Z [Nocardioides marmotae]
MDESVTTPQRLTAEFLGTFVLVLGGCGAAVLASGVLVNGILVGIGFLGVSFAFGLSVLTMAYAVGHLSGGHFNPAVTIGLAAGGRFAWKDVPAYVVVQVVGAIAAAAVLYLVASGQDGFSAVDSGFASNGYGDRSPAGYSLLAGLVIEVVLTAIFLIVILGVTDTRAPKGFAPLAIGLTLTLIHLVSIPVTNTSVNPARSIGPALFAGGDAIVQLWLFILAPILGAVIAGIGHAMLLGRGEPATPLEEASEG